eukprot:6059717-Prymnesium_polylepis.1
MAPSTSSISSRRPWKTSTSPTVRRRAPHPHPLALHPCGGTWLAPLPSAGLPPPELFSPASGIAAPRLCELAALEKLKTKIFEHMKNWTPVPNVQMH